MLVLDSKHLTDPRSSGSDAAGAASAAVTTVTDRFEVGTMAIVRRVGRGPIEPALDSELMADLGFDSMQVLELVGELEDHFAIAIPLNTLMHIRTVGQIAAEVRRLVTDVAPSQP